MHCDLRKWKLRNLRTMGLAALLGVVATNGFAQNFWSGSDTVAPAPTTYGSAWGSQQWIAPSGSVKQWKLGIAGSNTQTGVVVNQVAVNSAAARAGIKPQDTIVCVAGDQVGVVAGKVFDLTEELNLRATSLGQIEMLVLDAPTGRLRTITVQLDAVQTGLTGTLNIPAGAMPADAVVTVQLTNSSRPQYVVNNGEATFHLPSYVNGAIPFTLNFDPAYIFPNDSYQVRAYVTSAGRTLLDTTQPPYVLTRGNPSSVVLNLSAVSYGAYAGAGTVPNANSNVYLTSGYANYDLLSQRITAEYRRYLGRAPTALELAAWQQVPNLEYRMTTLPLELMASQEYFDRVGDNNALWMRQVFTEVIGHAPSALEQEQWMRRFAELQYSRSELLKQMQMVAQK